MNKKWKNFAVAYGAPLIGFIVYWYFSLTPLTIQSLEFWTNIVVYLIISAVIYFALDRKTSTTIIKINGTLLGLGVLALLVGFLMGIPLFRSKDFATLITHDEGNFEEDLVVTDPSKIPTIDRDMAERLGSRKLGEVLDLVSQFDVSNEFTQIGYQEQSIRVSPLEYVNVWRWFTNRSEGIPHYVTVDMVNGTADLVNLEENIRFSHSGFLNDDIKRHIFLQYPTTLFERPVFEIDDEGKPFYIAPILERQFSFLGPADVVGAFVVDAVTGDINRYDLEEIPTWVDRVFPANMIMSQIDYNGQFQRGYWNSIFTKRGVTQNAEGYNYIVIGDDLFLYTGLTSVASDESNVGFVLVNSRTKQSNRYNISTATEWSAMESAEGSVQETEYTSTFPLLFNMNGAPVYQLSLKDAAGLIKSYAFVDALNYQRVGIGNSLQAAWNNYNGGATTVPEVDDKDEDEEVGELVSISGEISLLESVVLNGETTYYFTLDDNDEQIYIAKVSLNNQLPFIQAGDSVTIEVQDAIVKSLVIE